LAGKAKPRVPMKAKQRGARLGLDAASLGAAARFQAMQGSRP